MVSPSRIRNRESGAPSSNKSRQMSVLDDRSYLEYRSKRSALKTAYYSFFKLSLDKKIYFAILQVKRIPKRAHQQKNNKELVLLAVKSIDDF